MSPYEATLINSHKFLGFATLLVIAPAVMWAQVGGKLHRKMGVLYVVAMTVLYVSGSYFTFTKPELMTFKVARNFLFNLFGYSMVIFAYRAVPVRRQGKAPAITSVDWALNFGLFAISTLMLPMGLKKWPMFVFGVLGIALAWRDASEFRRGEEKPLIRMHRHLRYMLASYYYLLTVVCILLFPGAYKSKWVAPTAIALPLVILLTRRDLQERLHLSRERAQRYVLRSSAILGLGLGIFILYEFVHEGHLITVGR